MTVRFLFNFINYTFVSRRYRISRYEFILDFMVHIALTVIIKDSWNAHEILLDIVQKQARLLNYVSINVPRE